MNSNERGQTVENVVIVDHDGHLDHLADRLLASSATKDQKDFVDLRYSEGLQGPLEDSRQIAYDQFAREKHRQVLAEIVAKKAFELPYERLKSVERIISEEVSNG